MSCNYCGESHGVKMYRCTENDNDICENCIESKKEYCNDFDYEGIGTKCPHATECEIYNMVIDEDEEELDNLINEIMSGKDIEIHNYVVVFRDYDSLYVSVKQDHNRPNDPDDEQIISDYILNEYGYRKYEIINVSTIEHIGL